MLHRVALE